MGHVVWGLIVAGGKSEQLSTGGADVALLNLAGKPILYYSLMAFEKCPEIDGIAVVAKLEILPEIQQMAHLFGFSKLRKIAAGSPQRTGCIKTGLSVMDESVTHVALHDVSRPLLDGAVLTETVKVARRKGCAVAASAVRGVSRTVGKGMIVQSTLDVGTVMETQTPMACSRELLAQILEKSAKGKPAPCDEVHAIELLGTEIKLVTSSPMNIKIADIADLATAEAMFKLLNPERHAGGNPIN